MTIDAGVWISDEQRSLRGLRSVLKAWIEECERYSKIVDDVCWWYNERANIGILSTAAARRKGWVSLEEFSNKKGRIDDSGAKRQSSGRCDLYFANRKTDYAMEFKHAWQPLFATNDPISSIRNKWTAAWSDAGCLLKDEADIRVAGVFGIPHYPKAKSIKEPDTKIATFIDQMKSLNGIGALAWCFLPNERYRTSRTGTVFPGVALALRARHKSTKSRG